jgi:hypothetical protein
MTVSTAGGPGVGLPPDSTNGGMANSGAGPSGAASSLSGEHLKEYALKRLRKAQAAAQQQGGRVTPPPNAIPLRRF